MAKAKRPALRTWTVVATLVAAIDPATGAEPGKEPIDLYFLRPPMRFVESPTGRSSAGFTIHLVIGGGLTASQQKILNEAKAAWEARISGYQPGIALDSVTIDVEAKPFDGEFGVLGSAGPTTIAYSGEFVVATSGAIVLDSADLSRLEAGGSLGDVIEHEIGHVLGIGTLWSLNDIYTPGTFRYTGAAGLAAWKADFSGQSAATSVPVEDEGGLGTAEAHWNEKEFGFERVGISDRRGNDIRDESMTGWLGANPFYSSLTNEHLKDLGFTVVPLGDIFADGFESGDVSRWSNAMPAPVPSCEISFFPQALVENGPTAVLWSSNDVATCFLTCDGGPILAEVLPNDTQVMTVGEPISCGLSCQDSAGDIVAACSADLPAQGTCPAPSCTASVDGSAATGYSLNVLTDGVSCLYSCPGFGFGGMDCNAPLALGSDAVDCRVYAASSCSSIRRCSSSAWSTTIVVDGDLGDWPAGTNFPTTGGQSYISWDADNIYIGMQHSAIGVDAGPEISVLVLLGNGDSGVAESPTIGTQSCYLPVPMTHAVRWWPESQAVELLTSQAGVWRSVAGSPPILVANDATAASVEISIPRSLLGLDQDLFVHLSILNEDPTAESSIGASPHASHQDGYLDENAVCEAVHDFDVTDTLSPNDSPWQLFDPFDLPTLSIPVPDNGFSLRIATFNGGYVDINTGEADMDGHIAGLCAAVGAVGPLLSTGIMVAGAAAGVPIFIPPDPALFFAACETAVNVVVDYVNDDLEKGIGGNLSHVDRAKMVADRILKLDLDVVALNEIFVEDARDVLVHALKSKYPYIVARIEPPADTTLDPAELVKRHFGAYYTQDSGLMLFSRHPFLQLTNLTHLVPDSQVDLYWQGSLVSNSSKSAVAFKQFLNPTCQTEDCNAGKGVALVRIQSSPVQAFAVAFAHTQASYGKDSDSETNNAKDIRVGQLGDIEQLINDTLTPTQRSLQEVFVLGDLNIIGRHPDGQSLNSVDWPDWDPEHEELTLYEDLNDDENRDWDLGRQDWLHNFCGLRTGGASDPCDNANEAESYLDNPSTPGFYACGNGRVDQCPDGNGKLFLTDGWAYDTSPHDVGRSQGGGALDPTATTCTKLGEGYFGSAPPPPWTYSRIKSKLCSGERLDYFLHNKPGAVDQSPSDRNSLCVQHLTLAWELSGAAGTTPLSDHIPVRGDTNRWFHHCRPVEAMVVDDAVLNANSNTFVAASGPSSNYGIKFPGSMQWFRIDAPGSYSLGINQGFGYDVYDEEDLSRPRPSYQKMESEWGIRYHLPNPPYYVRVYATKSPGNTPDREKTGDYFLTIHRHDCTDAEDACVLPSGSFSEALWPDEHFTSWQPSDPHYASGPDALWFIVTTYSDDDDRRPTLSFEYEAQFVDNYELEIVEFCPTIGPCGVPHTIEIGNGDFDAGPDTPTCAPCDQDKCSAVCQLNGPGPQDDVCPVEICAVVDNGVPAPRWSLNKRGKQYFLRVLRTEPLSAGGIPCILPEPCGAPEFERKMEVRYGTTLTFFYPDRLKLVLSEDDWGDDTDELWSFNDVNASSPTTSKTASYQWLGYATEDGPDVGLGHLGIVSYVDNVQVNVYSAADPNAAIDDTDPEWFVPIGASYRCNPNNLNEGVCPLDAFEVGSVSHLGHDAQVIYSDDPNGDTEEADYKAHLYFCAVHELATDANDNPTVAACKVAGKD